MKLKLGQTIVSARLTHLPKGSIVVNESHNGNITLLRISENLVAMNSVNHDKIHLCQDMGLSYKIAYLPPQLLRVGDEISKKDVNDIPVGAVFTYLFNQKWSVLVTADGFFIADPDYRHNDYHEEDQEDVEGIITNWDIMHKSIETVKIVYLPEGKHYV